MTPDEQSGLTRGFKINNDTGDKPADENLNTKIITFYLKTKKY